MGVVRRARHAGSWYEEDEKTLDDQLDGWLGEVDLEKIPSPLTSVIEVDLPGWTGPRDALSMPIAGCKAVIAPHAGYSYSGPAAAYAYKCIDPTSKRVFVLGPSHKIYLDGCSLSGCDQYSTPLGPLALDKATIKELRESGKFLKDMTQSVDENEHSIEMHLPYIRKVFEGRDISIVPILVGSISASQEEAMGRVLTPYLRDEETLFVVSSDFCHWGSRFDYTYYRTDLDSKPRSLSSRDSMSVRSEPTIHASIRALDGTAIRHLTYPSTLPVPNASTLPSISSSLSSPSAIAPSQTNSKSSSNSSSNRTAKEAQKEFNQYLKETKNTICGRHPIGVLLGALLALEEQGVKTELRFTRYEVRSEREGDNVPLATLVDNSPRLLQQSSEALSVRDSSVSYASAFVQLL